MHNEIFESDVFQKNGRHRFGFGKCRFSAKEKKSIIITATSKSIMLWPINIIRKENFHILYYSDANGKVLKDWDGFPNESPEAFTIEVRNSIYADK